MRLNKLTLLLDYYIEERENLIKRYSYRAGGPANAEDVVQEAFTRAIKYIDNYNEEDNPVGSWMNTICNNALKDFKKEERRQGMCTEEDRVLEDLELQVHDENLLDKILAEVDEMSEPSRSIISGFVFLGYQAKEVAQYVDANIWTVRKCIQMFYEDVRCRYE